MSARLPAARKRSSTSFLAAAKRTACKELAAACQRLAGSLPPKPRTMARKSITTSSSLLAQLLAAFRQDSWGWWRREMSIAQMPAALEERKAPKDPLAKTAQQSATPSRHFSGDSVSNAALQKRHTSSRAPVPTFRACESLWAMASAPKQAGRRLSLALAAALAAAATGLLEPAPVETPLGLGQGLAHREAATGVLAEGLLEPGPVPAP
mmetsp:Transcript_6058/g.13730  ORF Transcript_6058/g.13730 Transcript_6058/m.13730 type:complete len:209 (-) Transcript_6058:209-835(-)